MRFYKLKEALQDLYSYFFGTKSIVGIEQKTLETVTKVVNVGKLDVYFSLKDGTNHQGVVQGTLDFPLDEKKIETVRQLEHDKFFELTVDNQTKFFSIDQIKTVTFITIDNLKEVVYEKESK